MRARRRPVQDRVDRGAEAVVLVERNVVRLSPLAVALLDLLGTGGEWTPDHEVARELVARFGAPPEGLTALESTRDALRDLHTEGLVDLD